MFNPTSCRSAVALLLLLLAPVVFIGAQTHIKSAAIVHASLPKPQDESVEKVKAKIAQSPALAGMDIRVEGKNGVITLTGTVSSKAKKQLVLKLARTVVGTANVVDRIKISRVIALDFRCCCNGECWIQSRPCPTCDTKIAECAQDYAGDIKAADSFEARRAARQKFYECVNK